MVGSVAVPTIRKVVFRGACFYDDGLANFLVELVQRGRTEHDLILRVKTVAAQNGRSHFGVRTRAHDRDVLAVNLQEAEGDVGPRCETYLSCARSVFRPRGRDVTETAAAVHLVGPVPAVERGFGDQGVRLAPNVMVEVTITSANTVPRMAERTGTAAFLPLPGSSASRMPVTAATGRLALAATRAALDPRTLARRSSTDERRGTTRRATATARVRSGSAATATPSPMTVQSALTPCGTYGRNRSNEDHGREGHRHQPRQDRPRGDREHDADEAIDRGGRGRRSEGTNDGEVAALNRRPSTDHLTGDHQHGERGDETETPSAIDSGRGVLLGRVHGLGHSWKSKGRPLGSTWLFALDLDFGVPCHPRVARRPGTY